MRVALIGYGRSGWRIHGAFFKKEDNDICDVIAVVEYDPARQAAAKADFCCDTYSDSKNCSGAMTSILLLVPVIPMSTTPSLWIF